MYYGNAAATDRNLIERVGMVHVRRGALAAHVEPVLRGVVLTWHGSRDAAARREHALARYLQGAVVLGCGMVGDSLCLCARSVGGKQQEQERCMEKQIFLHFMDLV